MKKFVWLAVVTCISSILASSAAYAAPRQMSFLVMPHPDDEMQVWSHVEGSAANYKVFLYLTRGEETRYCDPVNYSNALQTNLGEVAPSATPQGKWTESCKEARISSTIGFLNAMATKDSSLPSSMSASNYLTIDVPLNGSNPQRIDNDVAYNSSSARVYNASNDMGKVIFFDLGDGDLSLDEVKWAVDAVKNNPSLFGLPSLPVYNMLGSYYNSTYTACVIYEHKDHAAIHTALYDTNFNVTGYQAGASCGKNPVATRVKTVSNASWQRAETVSSQTYQRTGYIQRYYGWLNGSPAGFPYASGTAQDQIHMQRQTFWSRF